MEINGVSINAARIGKIRFPTKVIIVRTNMSLVFPDEKPYKVFHLHRGWPDRGVPPADLAPIELCGRLNIYDK